jgi:hypothetical protein
VGWGSKAGTRGGDVVEMEAGQGCGDCKVDCRAAAGGRMPAQRPWFRTHGSRFQATLRACCVLCLTPDTNCTCSSLPRTA